MAARLIDANALEKDIREYADITNGCGRIELANGILKGMGRIKFAPVITLNTLRDEIYEDAVAHGLWESTNYTVDNVLKSAERCGDPFDDPDEVLRSWAMEPIRKEVNELEMASESEDEYTEELADVIIICFSVAGKLGIDIDAAIRRKMEINKNRPWKHGKE